MRLTLSFTVFVGLLSASALRSADDKLAYPLIAGYGGVVALPKAA